MQRVWHAFRTPSLGRLTIQWVSLGWGKGLNPTGFPAPQAELLFLRVRQCWLHLFQLVPVLGWLHWDVVLRVPDQELG